MRVSLPISTVGRASVFLSTRPTACARRNTKSGVMGACPTVPRMPSVPKYFLCHDLCLSFVNMMLRSGYCAAWPPSTFSACTVSLTSCTRTTCAPFCTASTAAATLGTRRSLHVQRGHHASDAASLPPATTCATSRPAADNPAAAIRPGAPAEQNSAATVLPKPMPGSMTDTCHINP